MKQIFITIVFLNSLWGIAKSSNSFIWVRTTPTKVITQDEWTCLLDQYRSFKPTFRVYGPNGKINQNAITSLKNWCAVNAVCFVSATYSPCFSNCNHRVTPQDQLNYLFTTLASNGMIDGVTVQVEIDPGYWPKNQKLNQKFLLDTLAAIRTNPIILTINILANETTWTKVFGPNFTTPSQNPYNYLWWVYHDAALIRNDGNNGNTTHWKSFGGWNKLGPHEYAVGQTNPECTNETFAYSH